MDRGTWKAFERRVAQTWGTVRNALSGGNSKLTRSDSLHDRLFVSCKHGKRSAFWTLYLEERPKALKEGKIPVLCLGNMNHEGFLVACHVNDLPEVVLAFMRAQGHYGLARELEHSLINRVSPPPEKNSEGA